MALNGVRQTEHLDNLHLANNSDDPIDTVLRSFVPDQLLGTQVSSYISGHMRAALVMSI